MNKRKLLLHHQSRALIAMAIRRINRQWSSSRQKGNEELHCRNITDLIVPATLARCLLF